MRGFWDVVMRKWEFVMRGICFSRCAGGRNLGPDSPGGAKRIHSSLDRRAQTGPAGFTGLDLQMERRGAGWSVCMLTL